MTNYQKVLITVSTSTSFISEYNDLMKILYKTEDEKLRKCLNDWLSVLVNANKLSDSNKKRKLRIYLNNNRVYKDMLVIYCKEMERLKKPEWQVLAERYGWVEGDSLNE